MPLLFGCDSVLELGLERSNLPLKLLKALCLLLADLCLICNPLRCRSALGYAGAARLLLLLCLDALVLFFCVRASAS